MSRQKKESFEDIERALLQDADNSDAWGEAIEVQASSAPRPSWYGNATKHPEAQSSTIFRRSSVRDAAVDQKALSRGDAEGTELVSSRPSRLRVKR
jgi:hypothetical protein